ncbi:hypothetical protein Glove_78g5 [Diversispora epigaea]|uniref:HAT C-terminal dimerisation domain-containing protein n=1 Tax=Diversispora epigaea TaxID=1348612 RepID=A0A397JFA6_9GLOM|nr:hypothetical protein Glove_78g5 [Diversispora epigaea]
MSRPRTYRLTKYIKVLGKQNSFNTYAACIGCVEKFDKDEISKNIFTNKKPQVKNHLKNCPYFLEKIGSKEEVDDIINLTDNEQEKIINTEKLMMTLILHLATLEFFEFLSPLLVLPKRKALSNRILNKEISELKTLQNEKLINDEIGVVLAFNGWKNVINQHIFGSLFITSSGENLIWNALDISSERERLIELILKIKDLIEEINHLGIKLNAIVSDKFPEIIFLLCIAHQCQLAIGDLFKASPILRTASSKAIMVTAFFKNANNSYFIGKLRDIQKEFYHKYYSIMVPAKTLIRNERPQISESNKLYLNLDLCEILLSNDRWEAIECLRDILLPYCGILNKLQCDKARPFEEQPLFLLSFILHPKYRFAYFNSGLNNLSFTSMEQYMIYYYKAWFKKKPLRLLLEFEDFCQKVEPFNDETFEQFGDNVFKFWRYVEGDYKELAAIVLKIFSICVNAAFVEQMWSSMGFLHTIRHNRLTNDKVLTMSQLRASINFSLREKESQQNYTQFMNSNIISIETNFNKISSTNKITISSIDDIDDLEENNTNIITTSEHWERELKEWYEMLIEKEVAQMEEKEALRNNSYSIINNDLLNEYEHPVIDKKAKWTIKILFNSFLDTPEYTCMLNYFGAPKLQFWRKKSK